MAFASVRGGGPLDWTRDLCVVFIHWNSVCVDGIIIEIDRVSDNERSNHCFIRFSPTRGYSLVLVPSSNFLAMDIHKPIKICNGRT